MNVSNSEAHLMGNRARRSFQWLVAIVAAVVITLLALVILVLPLPDARYVEFELRASSGSFAQLFWDTGSGFREQDSTRAALTPSATEFQTIRFAVPPAVRHLRFDPIDGAGAVAIRRARVKDTNGRELIQLNPASFEPVVQIASVEQQGPLTTFVASAGASDPQVYINASCLAGRASSYDPRAVTPLSLTIVSLAAALLIAGAMLAALGGSSAYDERATGEGNRPLRAVAVAAWLGALFALVLGAKLLLIQHYPSPVPVLDQWDAEARGLYVPYGDGCLQWRDMLALHNEHRIFFTRLLAMSLLSSTGQWDPQVQMAVNAAIHAATAVVLASVLWIAAGRRWLDLIAAVCAVAFAAPFGWENTLAGFQSAFYFLLLFSLLALGLTTRFPAGSAPWTLGWLCAFCALFTVAGGMITTVVILTVVLLRGVSERSWRDTAWQAMPALPVMLIGLVLASPPLERHAFLKAATLYEFVRALARNTAFPWIQHAYAAPVVWLPIVALAVLVVVRRGRSTTLERLLLGLALWVGLQSVAIAYSRGRLPPGSRYMDVFSWGVIAAALSGTVIVTAIQRRTIRRCGYAVMAAWGVFVVLGLDRLYGESIAAASDRHRLAVAWEQNVRAFVVTGDIPALLAKEFPREVPAPAFVLHALLGHEYLRRVLPAAVRAPLPLQPAENRGTAFARDAVYPTTPPTPHGSVFGSYLPATRNATLGRFESDAVQPCEPGRRLRFDVAGYLPQAGLSLAVEDLTTKTIMDVRPPTLPRESWVWASVPCPEHAFSVVAEDANPELWFAFAAPVETTPAASVVQGVIESARLWLIAGFAVAALAARLT